LIKQLIITLIKRHKKAAILTALPLFLFIKLAEDFLRSELTIFDNTIYSFLERFISRYLTHIMKTISYLGSPQILIVSSLVFLLVLQNYKFFKAYSGIILVNLAVSSTLNELFKVIFHRQRPDILQLVNAAGYSFPSGHSMTSLSFYGLMLYLICINTNIRWKRYVTITLLSSLILSIGISRIYLGVHFASDVLAGFSAGLVWLSVFIPLAKRFLRLNKINT
jgi:undecaprenyl-diphosphatase